MLHWHNKAISSFAAILVQNKLTQRVKCITSVQCFTGLFIHKKLNVIAYAFF